MASQEPRKFHHGDLKEALLKAALKLLDQHGPDGVTIRAVARETNVSHAAPVNHFKDRKALLTELVIRLFADLHSRIQSAIEHSKEAPDLRVASYAKVLIAYGLELPHRYDLMWRRDLIDTRDSRLQKIMDQLYGQLITEITDLNPAIRVDRDTVAIALWSLAHGYVTMRLTGGLEERRDTISGELRQDAMIEFLLATLRAPPVCKGAGQDIPKT